MDKYKTEVLYNQCQSCNNSHPECILSSVNINNKDKESTRTDLSTACLMRTRIRLIPDGFLPQLTSARLRLLMLGNPVTPNTLYSNALEILRPSQFELFANPNPTNSWMFCSKYCIQFVQCPVADVLDQDCNLHSKYSLSWIFFIIIYNRL